MGISFFPFPNNLSHVSVGDFLVNDGIFERVGSMFGEKEIDYSSHVYVQDQYV